MKKIVQTITLLLIISIIVPFAVSARGSITVNKSQISIVKGGTSSFIIIASNAAGRVDVSSSNSTVAAVSTSSEWLDNNTINVTVTGKNAGTATITINLKDAATYDEEELHNSYKINVTVSNPAPVPTPTPTPTPKPPTPVISPITGEDKRSNNSNLKSISVKNHKIEKVDDTHYSLNVKQTVEKIIVEATPEDEKATIKGIGEVSLKVGDNTIEVIVTAENQTTKTYYLKVNRKDSKYELSKLEEALKDEDEVYIVLHKDDVIQKEDLEKIKKASKSIEFVYYDENNNQIYNLIVNGNKLNVVEDFKVNAKTTFTEEEAFDQLTGYRKGFYLELTNTKKLLEGMSLYIPLSEEYIEGDEVNIYSYNTKDNKIVLLGKKEKINNNGIIISNSDSTHFFITKANIEPLKEKQPYPIFALILLIILFIINTVLSIIRIKKNS